MKKVWLILCGGCGAAAFVLVLLGQLEKAFVVAALGAVAWFLNYRTLVKERLIAEEEVRTSQNEEEDQL